jgi:hypothetical protein
MSAAIVIATMDLRVISRLLCPGRANLGALVSAIVRSAASSAAEPSGPVLWQPDLPPHHDRCPAAPADEVGILRAMRIFEGRRLTEVDVG